MNKFKFLVLVIICTISKVNAQQTIFNVPSATVTEKNVIFLQHESQFRPWNPDSFWLGTHYSAIGIGYNTELDATLFNVGAPNTHNITLGIGFKSALPISKLDEIFKGRELKFTVGSEVLVSLVGNGVGNWTYCHFSGRLPKINTRLTGGISIGSKQVFGKENVSFIAGLEQPITNKFAIIGDWYSGTDHYAGYLILGISYKFPRDTNLYLGFQIPNDNRVGQTGVVVEISKLITLKKTS